MIAQYPAMFVQVMPKINRPKYCGHLLKSMPLYLDYRNVVFMFNRFRMRMKASNAKIQVKTWKAYGKRY